MTRTTTNLSCLLTGLLAAGVATGCMDSELATDTTSYEARGAGGGGGGKPDRGGSSSGVSCALEETPPSAAGKLLVEGEPTRATSVVVQAVNNGTEPLLIGARIRTQSKGQRKSTEQPPREVLPTETISLNFDLRELGIDPAGDALPSRISASLIVQKYDGTPLERVPAGSVDVGPDVGTALDGLLSKTRMRARDLTTTDIKGLTASIVSIDQGDAGLFMDDLDDPDDDGGIGPTIPPNYSDAVPDEEGLYHYQFCLRWPVALIDAGFGEDYGIQPEADWKARGGKVKIESHDVELFNGYLDFDGCTPILHTPYHTDFWLIGYSYAKMNGNTIIAKDVNGNTHGWLRLVDEIGGSGTKYYTLAQGDLTNLVAVTSFVLARFGSVTNETFVLNNACYTEGDGCCDCAAGGEIWLDQIQRKFAIAHELGHTILAQRTGGYDNDCTLNVSNVHPCFSSSGHAMDSLEYQSCAAMEGWAHFVGVRAFNNHLEGDNPDAIMQYWRGDGETIDVEHGPMGGVETFFEDQCLGEQASMQGFGVELDWLRTWWDYHTNPSPGVRPDTGTMMDEIAENSGWFRTDTYTFITDGVEAFSGEDQRDRWTAIGIANGIDHDDL